MFKCSHHRDVAIVNVALTSPTSVSTVKYDVLSEQLKKEG